MENKTSKKIQNIKEAMLGITIVSECLTIFTIEEIKSFKTVSEFIDAIDTMNTTEEDWKEWVDSGVLELFKYAYETITELL